MANYSITITIDEETYTKMNSTGTRLCFASAVASGKKDAFNVVAYTTTVSDINTISWTDTYFISATKSKPSNGVKFKAQTTPAKIEFGETYTLTENWKGKTPTNDGKAPTSGFCFENQTDGASAIIYKMVEGNMSPIYISANGPLLPGTETLIPKPCCKIWFAKEVETNAFVDTYQSVPKDIDLTDLESVDLHYSVTGKWHVEKEHKRPKH
ncbi:hypothetical protein TWF696_007760 [Orbilia brochopaga]|uniref:Uncharacterized protein n=1 Tax=Orbilia brochopaga TaxID=3140254 RepID=A0AAV9UML5_9PEZI